MITVAKLLRENGKYPVSVRVEPDGYGKYSAEVWIHRKDGEGGFFEERAIKLQADTFDLAAQAAREWALDFMPTAFKVPVEEFELRLERA